MGQPDKKGSNGSTFSVGSIVELALFIIIIILIQIPMIYLAGSDQTHTQDPHPLDSVFSSKKHQTILKKMLKLTQKYVILEGQVDSGVKAFATHFASKEKNEKTVLMREYIQDPYEDAYAFFRFAKDIVEDQINLEDDGPKTWILFGFEKPIPRQDIAQLKANNPLDKIVIVTSESLKIKGFKHIDFPEISIEEVRETMKNEFEISQEETDVLVHHFQDISSIFKSLNDEKYSHEEVLGEFNKDLGDLSEDDEIILRQLCQSGIAQAKKTNQKLENVGLVFYKGKFYWENHESRLNYELKTLSQCEATTVSDQIMVLIEEELREKVDSDEEEKPEETEEQNQQQTQANEEKQEEQEEEQEKKPKKKEKKKDKKKKQQVEEQNEQNEEEEEEQKPKKKSKKEKKSKGEEKGKKKSKKNKNDEDL